MDTKWPVGRPSSGRRIPRSCWWCCCGAALLFVLNLTAQTPGAASGSRSPNASGQQNYSAVIDERVQQLAKGLDLNEAQQAAVKKILERRREQVLHIRNNSSISGEQRISQLRALQVDTVERIRATLNEEQKKKYDPLATRKIQQDPQASPNDWLNGTAPH